MGVDLGVGAGSRVFDGGFLVHPFPVGVVEFVQVGDPCGLRLPSFSGHPICTDLVSVGEDVHCESTAQEVHAGVPA